MTRKVTGILALISALILLSSCQSSEKKEPKTISLPYHTSAPKEEEEAEVSPPVPKGNTLPPKPSAASVEESTTSLEILEEPEEAREAEEPEEPDEPEEFEEPEGPKAEDGPNADGINVDELKTALEEDLNECTGDWTLYWKLLGTDISFSIVARDDPGADEKMVAASLIKLFVAGAYYDAMDQGKVQAAPDLIQSMISDSSNDACNELVRQLGNGDAAAGEKLVTQFAADIGCNDTEMNRLMLESSSLENYTSVSDCGKVLEMIYYKTYVNEQASTDLLDYLQRQSRTWKIPSGVPYEVKTANKTGELSDVENDVAIVWASERPYILCIMSDNIASSTIGQQNIVGQSKITYQYVTAAAEVE